MVATSWVKLRGDCTLESSFKSIVDQVRKDIECFNRLAPEKRRNRLFKGQERDSSFRVFYAQWAEDHRNRTLVVNQNLEDDHVILKIVDGLIHATRQDTPLATISQHWNHETLTCDLCIDDQPLSLGQISARILEPFFFDRTYEA